MGDKQVPETVKSEMGYVPSRVPLAGPSVVSMLETSILSNAANTPRAARGSVPLLRKSLGELVQRSAVQLGGLWSRAPRASKSEYPVCDF